MNLTSILIARDCKSNDTDACVGIYMANVFERVSFEYNLRDQIKNSLWPDSDFSPKFVVVEDDGKVVGFAAYSLLGFDAAGYGFSWCYVHPEYQSKGVGKLLVEARIQRIKALKGEFILSSQREEHKWHLERFGFKKIGTSGSYETERFALMQLVL